MKTNYSEPWVPLEFLFADNSRLIFEVQLLDAVINDLAIEPGRPDFRVKSSINELYEPSALQFANSTFPYLNLWFKYTQILAVEKHLKFPVSQATELSRIIFFEYLRIAEYIFYLATFSVNTGLNRVFSGLMEQYESLQRYFKMIVDKIAPDELISGMKRLNDLPVGFTERTLNILTQMQVRLQQLFPMLLTNRIVLSRLKRIDALLKRPPIPLSGGPNRRATGSVYDCRHDFPYSCYQKLLFDRVQTLHGKAQLCEGWQHLRVRCEEIFISINLIRQAVERLVYQARSSQTWSTPPNILKGHVSAIIETPWGSLTCQMSCSGGREPCEFTLTNPLHEIRLFLSQAAVGLELSDLPLLIATLGLRPKMEPL